MQALWIFILTVFSCAIGGYIALAAWASTPNVFRWLTVQRAQSREFPGKVSQLERDLAALTGRVAAMQEAHGAEIEEIVEQNVQLAEQNAQLAEHLDTLDHMVAAPVPIPNAADHD